MQVICFKTMDPDVANHAMHHLDRYNETRKSRCHDLKEILWVPNFYYICQICYLRLGVRSSGFAHD